MIDEHDRIVPRSPTIFVLKHILYILQLWKWDGEIDEESGYDVIIHILESILVIDTLHDLMF